MVGDVALDALRATCGCDRQSIFAVRLNLADSGFEGALRVPQSSKFRGAVIQPVTGIQAARVASQGEAHLIEGVVVTLSSVTAIGGERRTADRACD